MFLRIHSKVATNEAVTTFPHRRAQSSSNDAKNSGTSALWSEKRHTYRFRWPPSCRRRSTGSAPPHSRPNLDRSQSWRSQSVETATCLPQTPGSFRMWSRSRLQRFFRSPPWAPVMHRRHRAQRLPLFLQRKGTLAGRRRSGGFFFPPFKNLWKKKKKSLSAVMLQPQDQTAGGFYFHRLRGRASISTQIFSKQRTAVPLKLKYNGVRWRGSAVIACCSAGNTPAARFFCQSDSSILESNLIFESCWGAACAVPAADGGPRY